MQLHRPHTIGLGSLSENDKVMLMHTIKRIAAIYDESLGYHFQHRFDEYRDMPVEPRERQTRSGILLEYYDGTPRQLFTPWGSWHLGEIEERLFNLHYFEHRVSIRLDRQQSDRCDFGVSIFGVLAVDRVELPEPVAGDGSPFTLPVVARRDWERLFNSVD